MSADVVLMFLPFCAFFADVSVVGHSQPTAVIPFAMDLFSLSVSSIVVNVVFVWHAAHTNPVVHCDLRRLRLIRFLYRLVPKVLLVKSVF